MPAAAAKPHWPVVTIVGVGLIGGSIGLALRDRKLAGRVIGVGRSTASLAEAKRLGTVTETTADLAKAVASADVVVARIPPSFAWLSIKSSQVKSSQVKSSQLISKQSRRLSWCLLGSPSVRNGTQPFHSRFTAQNCENR